MAGGFLVLSLGMTLTFVFLVEGGDAWGVFPHLLCVSDLGGTSLAKCLEKQDICEKGRAGKNKFQKCIFIKATWGVCLNWCSIKTHTLFF